MRRLLSAVALLAVASLASAKPLASEDQLDVTDVAALKSGDWVQYDITTEFTPPGGGEKKVQKSSMKMACVKVDADSVWVEMSHSSEKEPDVEVVLLQYSKSQKKVTQAWTGKPGEAGKVLEVRPAAEKKAKSGKGSGKAGSEKLRVGDKEHDCVKLEVELTQIFGAREVKSKVTAWFAKSVSFAFRLDDEKIRAQMFGQVEWTGPAPTAGGMVKMTTETDTVKSTMALAGTGTDAKQTLEVK